MCTYMYMSILAYVCVHMIIELITVLFVCLSVFLSGGLGSHIER